MHKDARQYAELLEEVEHSDYCATLITIEVGSCGLIHMEGLDHLQKFLGIHNTRWAPFLVNVSQRAMEESHRIWTEKNWRGVADIDSLIFFFMSYHNMYIFGPICFFFWFVFLCVSMCLVMVYSFIFIIILSLK